MMKRIIKITLISLAGIFVLIQFYPRRNNNISPGTGAEDISVKHHVPQNVRQILATSCYDCHSNNTSYPWYSAIQPLSMWLSDHIDEGKKELNFSVFGSYSVRRQYRKLEEINEMVTEGEMPLKSYTFIHRSAKLDEAQKQTLALWAVALSDSFTANYPPDSLKRPK